MTAPAAYLDKARQVPKEAYAVADIDLPETAGRAAYLADEVPISVLCCITSSGWFGGSLRGSRHARLTQPLRLTRFTGLLLDAAF